MKHGVLTSKPFRSFSVSAVIFPVESLRFVISVRVEDCVGYVTTVCLSSGGLPFFSAVNSVYLVLFIEVRLSPRLK